MVSFESVNVDVVFFGFCFFQKGYENKANDHQLKNPWLFNKFSLSNPLEIYREHYEGNASWF